MNKNLFFVATVALAFAACSQSETLIDEAESPEVAIGFDTYANKATRGAENSGSTTSHGLEDHHADFRVWGYKTVNGAESSVFLAQQKVEATTSGETTTWNYTPGRYWDKSASKYAFYAAAPFSANWEIVEPTTTGGAKTLKYKDFSLTGVSLDVLEAVKNGVSANASFKGKADKDLMISHDILSHTTYTSTAVNLEFDHILSRLNIGVAQDNVSEKIYLNSITLVGHKSNGTFDESLAAASTSGSIARWATAPSSQAYYTEANAVGYANADGLALNKIANASTDKYKYVYQGLVIPQTVGVQSDLALDGSNSTATGVKPYLKLVYTVEYQAAKEAVLYTYAEYKALEGNSEVTEEAFNALTNEAKTKTPAQDAITETFTYYYNIAYIFTKTYKDSTPKDFTFYEGFQNNLNILISPAKINFDAVVYEWDTKQSSDYTVPDGPTENAPSGE